jgi:hypothetical protein
MQSQDADMETFHLTEQEVLTNRILKLGFGHRFFSPYLKAFVDYSNMSAEMDSKDIMRDMLGIFEMYGNISISYRTAALDFAWSVHQANPQNWNEEERETEYADIYAHLYDLRPGLDPKIVEKDIATLEYGSYFVIGMDICFIDLIEEILKPSICRSMYEFFKQWSGQFDDAVIEEARAEMEEWIENKERRAKV